MPYTKDDYPVSMKNLPASIRNKAIEIANAMLEEHKLDEGRTIATAISRAKDWAENHNIDFPSSPTDQKEHGKDSYVIPYADHKWAIREEGRDQLVGVYDRKDAAIKEARSLARRHRGSLTIQKRSGQIQRRISYNPARRKG